MSFTLDAADEFGIPEVLFWTPSACGVLGYTQYKYLVERGLTPLKDDNDLTNGYLDTTINWIPGMKNIRLRDLPSFIRTTGGDPNELMVKFLTRETERSSKATAIIINTFDPFEHDVLKSLSSILPPIYAIGPLNLMMDHISNNEDLKSIETNLWKEDTECIEWLDKKEDNSVVYVNFGSITVMTTDQLVEFAWGLANSEKQFLWIIRPDLVTGDLAMLPPEFVSETSGRGKLASWCSQEQILSHPAIAGFLTHCGWNSTLESISRGVPMICWPFFAEQQTNCWFMCNEWGIGLEIDNDVKREKVEGQVRELLDGVKGTTMKKKAMEWKKRAEEAVKPDGSSYIDLEKVFNDVLLKTK